MEQIKAKIVELQAVSEGNTRASFENFQARYAKQNSIIKELKALARENKTLLGRIITFPHADSSAMYVIDKLNKRSVRLTWVDYCDGWVDSRAGKQCTINIDYAQQEIDNQDNLSLIFSNK